MIAIVTNQGALEIGRSLSGGSRFLAWEAALLRENFANDTVAQVAGLSPDDIDLDSGTIGGRQIVGRFECTGSLPVQVSSEEGGTTVSAMAVDFDFNGQAPISDGAGSGNVSLEYSAVVALARRYMKYSTVSMGTTYHAGDRVWLPYDVDPARSHAYMCITDSFEYAGVLPGEDTVNWSPMNTGSLVRYPGDADFYCDPGSDIIPFFVTSYDDTVTMANGMEWEYKVRVFLDNVVTANLSELQYFSKGGLEANGSLMLSFLANTAEMFRAIRNQVTTST